MEFGETVMNDVEERIDQGRGVAMSGGAAGVERARCVRRGCRSACEGDSGFCGPCLAWVSGEPVPDPREKDHETQVREVVMPYPPEPTEEWNDYLQRAQQNA